MSASNYLELELLDHVLGGADYTRPATVYISLHTGDPGETGASEVASSNNYSRASVTNNATNFPAAASGSKSNDTVIQFATPSGTWGTVTHFGIWDAATTGNFLFGGALSVSKTINSGDDVEFGVGAMTITAD